MKRSGLPALAVFAALLLLPKAAFGQLSSGLLNYWNFEGNFNDTAGLVSTASTVVDNGTAQPSVTLASAGGILGQYGNFNHGYVSVPNSADILMAGQSLTISAWFQVSGFDSDWQALIAHGEGSDYRIARRANEQIMAYAGGAADIPGAGVGPVVSDAQWHHVVAISENAVSTRLWIDNTLIATGAAPTLTNNGAAQLQIGGNPNAGRAWFGFIDDVAMWKRPLTDQEIGSIYTAGRDGKALSTLMVNTDSDLDGLPDTWETLYGLNPNSNVGDDGAAGDPDLDGLTNAQEFNPRGTNPKNPDTDNDGLKDGEEISPYNTNPLIADTDGDGLSDGLEVNTYHTNPLQTDTDGDGAADGAEVANGTNPAVANSGLSFGLYAYWPMDSDYNSTTGGFTTTPMGTLPIPLVPGKFGNALQTNGANQFLQVDGPENNFDFVGQSMSLSAWFTADTIDKDWQCLVAKGDASGHWRFHRRGADQPPEMSICMGSADTPKPVLPATSAMAVGTGRFHNIVGVSKLGDSVKLYFDGVLAATGPAPSWTDSANPMKIAANPDTSPPRFWTGKIDDLAIWKRALTDEEISLIWNGGTGTSIGDLLGPPVLFQFTQVSYDKATNKWTLKWTSKPGRTYTLKYSNSTSLFPNDLDDSIPSGGLETTYGPFDNPSNAARLFFQAVQN